MAFLKWRRCLTLETIHHVRGRPLCRFTKLGVRLFGYRGGLCCCSSLAALSLVTCDLDGSVAIRIAARANVGLGLIDPIESMTDILVRASGSEATSFLIQFGLAEVTAFVGTCDGGKNKQRTDSHVNYTGFKILHNTKAYSDS